jgi:hypothetical protein
MSMMTPLATEAENAREGSNRVIPGAAEMLEPPRVEGLARHPEDRYGLKVADVTRLDAAVFRGTRHRPA